MLPDKIKQLIQSSNENNGIDEVETLFRIYVYSGKIGYDKKVLAGLKNEWEKKFKKSFPI